MKERDESLNGQLCRLVTELVTKGVTLEQARREFERQFIIASLRTHEGNYQRSAKSLGVHRNTLRNKVSTLGIRTGDYELGGPRRSRSRSRG